MFTSPSVHELAQAISPDAHVLYVDNDPVVIAHNSAILTGSGGVTMIKADIRDFDAIFASREFKALIDLGQPLGVLMVAVLHFVPGDVRRIVGAFADRMCPGSYLALSHVTSDGADPGVLAVIRDAYAAASAPAVFRTRAQISELFTGFDLVSPGLVDVTQWLPYGPALAAHAADLGFLAGLARKP